MRPLIAAMRANPRCACGPGGAYTSTAKLARAAAGGRSDIDHNALADMMPTIRAIDALTSKLRALATELGIAA